VLSHSFRGCSVSLISDTARNEVLIFVISNGVHMLAAARKAEHHALQAVSKRNTAFNWPLPPCHSGGYRFEMAWKPLRDVDVRQAAYRRLLVHAQSCPDTLVIDELGLDHGSCRIDIAVINGHIRGVEIKAEADTLARLPRQVAAYGEVVDKALLIVDPKHLASAMTMVPDWWGVMVAERGATQGVKFRRVRAERANKGIDPLVLARLLWRPEAQDILRSLGIAERDLRVPREDLYQRIVSLMPLRKLSNAVRTSLKSRTTWRDQPPLS
jgi:hypothetical protein